jgi:hypothetical protein
MSDTRAHVDVAIRGGSQGADQLLLGDVLRDVAARARAKCLDESLVLRMHCQNDHRWMHVGSRDRLGGGDTAGPWHVEIHEDDVWFVALNHEDGFLTGFGFADDLDVLHRLEHSPQPGANQQVVVDQEHPDQTISGHRNRGRLAIRGLQRRGVWPCRSEGSAIQTRGRWRAHSDILEVISRRALVGRHHP